MGRVSLKFRLAPHPLGGGCPSPSTALVTSDTTFRSRHQTPAKLTIGQTLLHQLVALPLPPGRPRLCSILHRLRRLPPQRVEKQTNSWSQSDKDLSLVPVIAGVGNANILTNQDFRLQRRQVLSGNPIQSDTYYRIKRPSTVR